MAKNDAVVCRECDKTMKAGLAVATESAVKIRYECETNNCNNYSERVLKNEH